LELPYVPKWCACEKTEIKVEKNRSLVYSKLTKGIIVTHTRLFILSAISAAALSFQPSVAHASTLITIPTASSSPSTGNSAGRTFTVSVGSTTIKTRVTAWSTTGTSSTSAVNSGGVNIYTQGLGITSIGESTSSPHHTIDNLTRRDFLIFQFDQPVELESVRLTTYLMSSNKQRYDGDLTFAHGSTTTNWQTNLLANTATFADVSTLFANTFTASNVPSTSSQTTSTRMLNSANNIGNIWLIGAAFDNPAENCGTNNAQACLDGFKLSQITVRTAVPEPATWLMMLTGFGFIGFSMRRRQKRNLAAA
jgi:PEP-CTERM motif